MTEKRSLIEKVASRYDVEPGKMLETLKQTAFSVSKGEVTNAQMMALLIVADQYRLNPWTKEIYAFPDGGGVIPVVGVDGWSRLINDNPNFDGLEFNWAPEHVVMDDHSKECPAWCEVTIYRKDRSHPITVREYLDEVYRPPFKKADGTVRAGPWQTHTKRLLRHKTLIQGSRVAFALSGIYDQDEAERIVEGQVIDVEVERPKTRGTERLKEALADEPSAAEMAEVFGDAKVPEAEVPAEGEARG